jgi:hypothetical protein
VISGAGALRDFAQAGDLPKMAPADLGLYKTDTATPIEIRFCRSHLARFALPKEHEPDDAEDQYRKPG